MRIKMEQDPSYADIDITVRYAEENNKVKRIISYLQSVDTQIKCNIDDTEKMINVADIYYIESVEKKTFVYLEKLIYYTNFRLYQLAEDLKEYGFVQISKSCILNINVLESIKPLFNSRMEATLKNGEKVFINRKYLREVKRALGGDDEA
ncbi:MAG: LytTR family transcriptional regulator [Clostridiales bacterium]|nr:LytTR family transcriptional regulator [Clostridiales bacterium]